MPTYVKRIRRLGMGAFTARDLDDAYEKTCRKHGQDNVEDVEEASDSDLRYISGMGGFVPRSDRERLGLNN